MTIAIARGMLPPMTTPDGDRRGDDDSVDGAVEPVTREDGDGRHGEPDRDRDDPQG